MSRTNKIKNLSNKTQDIIKDITANISIREIAKKYDVSCQYVYHIKKRYESNSWN